MNKTYAIARDQRGTVRITGRASRACQAKLANELSQEAGRGMRRLDLTDLDALNVATVEVLFVLAAEIDLELIVRADTSVARKAHEVGLDGLADVSELPEAHRAQPPLAATA